MFNKGKGVGVGEEKRSARSMEEIVGVGVGNGFSVMIRIGADVGRIYSVGVGIMGVGVVTVE
jgi:hypothetical protein